MLCWLCNEVEIPEIIMDPRDGKIRYCHVCAAIIQDNLQAISGHRLDDGEDPILDYETDVVLEGPELDEPFALIEVDED